MGVLTCVFRPAPGFHEILRESVSWLVRERVGPSYIAYKIIAGQLDLKTVARATNGPIFIGQMLFETYETGIWSLLFMWAVISAGFGASNLCPFPGTDGGRLLLTTFAVIRGRPLDYRVLHFAGLGLLLLMCSGATLADIVKMLN